MLIDRIRGAAELEHRLEKFLRLSEVWEMATAPDHLQDRSWDGLVI